MTTTERRLSPKQQTAVDFLRANPTGNHIDMLRAAQPKGGVENDAMFIYRLLDRGVIRLTVSEED